MSVRENPHKARLNWDWARARGHIVPDFRFTWGGFFKWSGITLLTALAGLVITLYFLDWNQMRGPLGRTLSHHADREEVTVFSWLSAMEFLRVKCYGPPPEILLTSGKMLHPSDLSRTLIRYCEPDMRRALFEVGITVVPLVLLWVLMWLSLDVGYWLTLLLAVPAGGFLVRLFIIQHDCGHGAFFRQRAANAWVGRVLGVLTLTPFDYWKRNHAIHHATSSNLDKRGIGDIDLLTVEEYRGKSWWGRMLYRCYRSAPVMFVIGPAWLFLLQHRLPFHQWRDGWRPWISTMATNAAIVLSVTGMIWLVGVGPFVMVHLPIMLLAASMGVWLFYVQHQFEDVAWARTGNWSHHDSALWGSSYYDLPGLLRWFSGNIGIHHIHHLNSRIPYYRLPNVLQDHPELKAVGRLTLWDSVKSIRLSLWCEQRNKLVSFKGARSQ